VITNEEGDAETIEVAITGWVGPRTAAAGGRWRPVEDLRQPLFAAHLARPTALGFAAGTSLTDFAAGR